MAAYKRQNNNIQRLQSYIVNDIDIKCLAVRHVANSGSGPGVDRIRWKTPAEYMRAALTLSAKGYKAKPLRQIGMKAKNTGKMRYAGIPTYFDRAMNVLYGYSFIPVAEAHAERKSFAFRFGRSAHDAQAYVLECLRSDTCPPYVVCCDVKSYFATIQHEWLLKHIPMDKKVLEEFISAGFVFAGELFPTEGYGISEGSNLSPYLGNYVLNGLQRHIYIGLQGSATPKDYSDGNLIRFADDIIIFTRTKSEARQIIRLVKSFLSERGLSLSEGKTSICETKDGFDFLSQTFVKRGGYVYSYPSEDSVERFISNIKMTISNSNKSQRDLIMTLNQKLRGWANYHKYSDAEDAFRRVDTAVQTALLEAAMDKHPKWPRGKVINKYWYLDQNGYHIYCLPEDKSVRVIKLMFTMLSVHEKVKTNLNPFLEKEYIENRSKEKQIQNVVGGYRSIWERQNGRCYYCGRPILIDHPKAIVQMFGTKRQTLKNSAYVHKMCALNDFQLVKTVEDTDLYRPYDVLAALHEIEMGAPRGAYQKPKEINADWKYIKLKDYFADAEFSKRTLTFKQIEEILGEGLPKSAYSYKDFWMPRKNMNRIAEAWISGGYHMKKLDLDKKKVQFVRDEVGTSQLEIPNALIEKKIPDNAAFELEQFFKYIIKKYAI